MSPTVEFSIAASAAVPSARRWTIPHQAQPFIIRALNFRLAVSNVAAQRIFFIEYNFANVSLIWEWNFRYTPASNVSAIVNASTNASSEIQSTAQSLNIQTVLPELVLGEAASVSFGMYSVQAGDSAFPGSAMREF